MPGTAFNQPNYPSPSQSGALYPTSLDAITQVMARIAVAFNPHAVPATAAAPVLSAFVGGTFGARTYYVKITYVTPSGEVTPSAESSLVLSASNLLNVASPTGQLGVTGWNVYVSTASGAETKQNASPIAVGSTWVEPTSGLISGATPPAGLSIMTVIVDAGAVFYNGALTEKAVQTLTFTAPTTNPRIDRIVLDPTTGIASKVAGTEAASPSPPAIPPGKTPIAQVALSVGQMAITNSNITDERVIPVLTLINTPTIQVFTAAGTWTKPADCRKVKVTVVGGGGGGGGNYGGGGGGGGASIKYIDVTAISSVSVTVGSGGSSETTGGTSSFGAYCSATGGGAGVNAGNGGTAGTGTGGDINIRGNAGDRTVSGGFCGGGGSSFLGGGGGANNGTGGDGIGGNYGGGGAGGSGGGQAGAGGVVTVEEFY